MPLLSVSCTSTVTDEIKRNRQNLTCTTQTQDIQFNENELFSDFPPQEPINDGANSHDSITSNTNISNAMNMPDNNGANSHDWITPNINSSNAVNMPDNDGANSHDSITPNSNTSNVVNIPNNDGANSHD